MCLEKEDPPAFPLEQASTYILELLITEYWAFTHLLRRTPL